MAHRSQPIPANDPRPLTEAVYVALMLEQQYGRSVAEAALRLFREQTNRRQRWERRQQLRETIAATEAQLAGADELAAARIGKRLHELRARLALMEATH